MTDLEQILPLWNELEEAGADYVLATVVAVEGSSYRRPGARMLLAQDGRRAGTVSGGCLEADVAKRAWWVTENGPVVERYSTLDDDGDLPYGSGCGGVVSILQERRATAGVLLTALKAAFDRREPLAIATVLRGAHVARRAFAGHSDPDKASPCEGADSELQVLAKSGFAQQSSLQQLVVIDGASEPVWVDYRAARPGLWIFGAGDDARPLVHLARQLGWYVAVADGRSHLAMKKRFTAADEVMVLDIKEFPNAAPTHLDLHSSDAAVLMTHSFEQDARILAWLMRDWGDRPLAYAGVLGPQRRTRELLAEAAPLLNLADHSRREEEWMHRIHAPMGLDLGADTPSSIALSILAEIQKALTSASALPLRLVRGTKTEQPSY